MDHLLGILPGCCTLEEAEGHYRVEAMQMELRDRRVRDKYLAQAPTTIKGIERHFDELKQTDPDVYVTYLYTTARLGAVLSDVTDAQLRRAQIAVTLAVDKLYADHTVIRPVAWDYRHHQMVIDARILDDVRDRVRVLLPEMISVVRTESQKSIPVRTQFYTRKPLPAEEPLSPVMAEAMLRLRVLAYLRHPIDLVREISRWISEMECSE